MALSAAAQSAAIDYPFICLVASGGHTLLVLVREPLSYEIVGRTIDLNRHRFTVVGVAPAVFRGTMNGLRMDEQHRNPATIGDTFLLIRDNRATSGTYNGQQEAAWRWQPPSLPLHAPRGFA